MSKDTSLLSILNPVADNPPAPSFFKPFGSSKAADKYNRKTFQIAALLPIYALLGAALRHSMSSDELKKLETTGELATAMTSPVRKNVAQPKVASDLLYQGTMATTIPILVSLGSLFGGMKIADRYKEKKTKQEYEAEIKRLESAYNKEILKRIYPNAKQASAADDIISSLGIVKLLAPLSVALAVGTAIPAKKYFDDNSKPRKDAKKLKKALEHDARLNWVPKLELQNPNKEIQ